MTVKYVSKKEIIYEIYVNEIKSKNPQKAEENEKLLDTLYKNLNDLNPILNIKFEEFLESGLIESSTQLKDNLKEFSERYLELVSNNLGSEWSEIKKNILELIKTKDQGIVIEEGSKDFIISKEFIEQHPPRDKLYEAQFEQSKKIFQKLNVSCHICDLDYQKVEKLQKQSSQSLIAPNNEEIKMELHHFYIEFSYVNTIDIDKFNEDMLPLINSWSSLKSFMEKNPEKFELVKDYQIMKDLKNTNYTLNKLKSTDELKRFICSHPLNMMPLCTLHHRSKNSGIHSLVQPYWKIQNLMKAKDLVDQLLLNFIVLEK